MEQKIKFILAGLIGVVAIVLFFYAQALTSKQSIAEQRDQLKKENTDLAGQLDETRKAFRDYESRVEALNKELDQVSRSRSALSSQLDAVIQEKEDLARQLEAAKAARPMIAEPKLQLMPSPQTTDAHWAEVLKEKADLEIQLANVRNELRETKINKEELQRQGRNSELDIKNLRREAEDISRQLEYNQQIMDSIAEELVRERNDKIKIQESFQSIKDENRTLIMRLKDLNTLKIKMERKVQELIGAKTAIERRFNEMETMLMDKVSQVDNLKKELESVRTISPEEAPLAQKKKETVELPAIVIRPQIEPSISAGGELPVQASVISMNRDNNFVVIDLGQNDGLQSGDAFGVYRNNQRIAEIEVIQLRSDIAACDIVRENKAVVIGDEVK